MITGMAIEHIAAGMNAKTAMAPCRLIGSQNVSHHAMK
jgi:hypothetical protein